MIFEVQQRDRDAERSRRIAARYESWVSTRTGAPASADKCWILAEPSADLPLRVEAARCTGVERFVCGFLPDEVDWHKTSQDLLAYFVDRFEFMPLRFDLLNTRSERTLPPCVIVLRDSMERTAEALGWAYAQAIGGTALIADVQQTEPSEIARKLVDASLFINASCDWTWGFAFDELAARCDIPVVRLSNPGYSPIRYAPLGIDLPLEISGPSANLRPALSVLHWLRPGSSNIQIQKKKSTELTTPPWRDIYAVKLHTEFWAGADVSNLIARGMDEPARWANRSHGWPAARAALSKGLFSSTARDWLEACLVRWVVAETKQQARGSVRDVAVAHWIRLRPRWLGIFHDIAGETRHQRDICKWIRQALLWGDAPGALRPFLREVKEVAGADLAEDEMIASAIGWATSWRGAQRLPVENPLNVECRQIILQVCLERMGETRDGLHTSDELSAFEKLIEHPNSWRAALGDAGPVMQIAVAAKTGGRRHAMRAIRSLRRADVQFEPGGWLRLWRRAFDSESTRKMWLRGLLGKRTAGATSITVSLVTTWFNRNIVELWRRQRSLAVERELHIARRQLDRTDDPLAIHLGARLAALADDEETVIQMIGRYAATKENNNVGELAPAVALIHAYRGRQAAARAVLSRWRPEGTEVLSWFLHAIASVFTGDEDEALQLLAQVRQMKPDYFRDRSVRDSRWMLMACVCRSVGLKEQAEEYLQVARGHVGAGRQFIDLYSSTPVQPSPRIEEWRRLVALA